MKRVIEFMVEENFVLDYEKMKHMAETFTLATGVACQVVDSQSGEEYLQKANDYCFCQELQRLDGHLHMCRKMRMYAGYQAERFGGKYIFFCPSGAVHFIAPIVIDNQVKAALLGGPVLMIDHEEFFSEEIETRYKLPSEVLPLLKKELLEIPFVLPERVSGLSELLTVVAGSFSKEKPFGASQERLDQQSDISEYIHVFKQLERSDDYPMDKEKELLTAISEGNKKLAQKLLNEILGYIFFSSGGSFEIIRARVIELVVLLSRSAMDGGADAEMIFGMNYQYLKEINRFSDVERLAFWLSKIMVRFTDCVFNFADMKHADVIHKAVDYIKRNYMKKTTLEEVAEHVFLSATYFSKVFKDEMQENFNTYLNRYRIEVAKKMLLSDNIALVDISNVVGFEDQSYFSKVFKKVVGVTPGKYKESRGKIKTIQEARE